MGTTDSGGRVPRQVEYLPPSWFERRVIAAIPGADEVAARVMSAVTGDSVLQIRGRRTGRLRSTLARTLILDDKVYVVAIRGNTHSARNLRVAGEALVRDKSGSRHVRAVEAVGEEQRRVVEAFLTTSKYGPTRRIMSEVLPASTQHPVFRLGPRA